MHELDDSTLLREFTEGASESAFAELVARHVNKVYSVALRYTRNPHEAEEITQAVFVILAQKARRFRKSVILSGWLYQTARLTAITFIRSEIRRTRREQEAFMPAASNQNESDVWTQIAPMVDDAIADLSETDRRAVVLRYFDGKSVREVSAALGGSEEAARMRLSRAIEKLRKFLALRGVAFSGTAIAGAVAAYSVRAAPVTLAKSATAASLTKGSAAVPALAKATMKIMAWMKIKTTASAAAAGLLVACTVSVAVSVALRAHQPYLTPGRPQPTTATSPGAAAIPGANDSSRATADLAPAETAVTTAIQQRYSPAQPIYPIAPLVSDLLAAAKANSRNNGGFVTTPPDMWVQLRYDNLFQKLNLTPEQIAVFTRIMVDKQNQTGDILRANPLDYKTLAGLSDDEKAAARDAYQQQMDALTQPADDVADAQVKQLLGSDANYNYYQTYNDQQQERAVVMGGYRGGLNAAGIPALTLDQDEQLVNLFYQARLDADDDADAEAEQVPQILQQAAAFLTPDQIQALTNYTRSLVGAPMNGMGAGSVSININ